MKYRAKIGRVFFFADGILERRTLAHIGRSNGSRVNALVVVAIVAREGRIHTAIALLHVSAANQPSVVSRLCTEISARSRAR